jgi:hypothetical protein
MWSTVSAALRTFIGFWRTSGLGRQAPLAGRKWDSFLQRRISWNPILVIPSSLCHGTKAAWSGRRHHLKLKEISAIRIRRQLAGKVRDLALFNLAIDSKLRGCDLVSLRICDIAQGKSIFQRAVVM